MVKQMQWEVFDKEDFELTDNGPDGCTVVAVTGMLAEDRSLMGPRLRSGKHSWEMTNSKIFYTDAHIFFGVADATEEPDDEEGDPEVCTTTWGYSPPTGSLYIGSEPNEHGTEDKFKICETEFWEKGFIDHKCIVTVDLDSSPRTLSFTIDDEDPVTIEPEMPEVVRPWCFIYHEGDTVHMKTLITHPV
mmetsp:Transcript_428/g.797  ORF Transcript_428/g.797 Transcript_428/m.797 type:complete len:189 (+) Transcript_428:32-598(+)|eukprot:CAMPEP_0119335084 /NCGR_PEP_ID=MMETSP1333-20130426/88632_1 /TAXON_ID=418940 /ORGANISM="Scyphosphaera apsteinii, Strain RCC1455" /LENGTH=188 /DNA_ID=CAMNT_0007345541 /DNA_START=32 /DNA_END=598 /DNA_ORIENTATION=-